MNVKNKGENMDKKIEVNGLTNQELKTVDNLHKKANLQQLSAIAISLSSIINQKMKEQR